MGGETPHGEPHNSRLAPIEILLKAMKTPNIRLGRSPPTKPRAGRKLTLEGTSSRHFKRLQRAQEELKQARHYAEAIVEAVPPLLVLDANLRVKTANESLNSVAAS